MVSQDRTRQERLLNLAGWLYHKHRYRTAKGSEPYSEFRFTRQNLDDVPALSSYGLDAGEAGERAMLRDVSALRSFGIEVEWDPEHQEWVSRAAPLTDDECRALATAALSVLIDDGFTAQDGYHIPGAGLSTAGAELIIGYAPITDLLIEAIRTKTPIEIEHRGMTRHIDPWHVSMADGRWYVTGREHLADERRTFAMDSIARAELSGQSDSYSIPKQDNLTMVEETIDPDRWTDSEPVDVTVSVDPRLAVRAQALLDAEVSDQAADSEWVELRCTIRSVDAFLHRLWGLRARAVVIGPASIRNQVTAALEAMH